MKYIWHIFKTRSKVYPNWKDILLVGEVPSWLSPMVGTAKKSIQVGIFLFVEVQERNWQGNLQGSKCDGYFVFLWNIFSF